MKPYVLLVDDEIDTLESLSDFLELNGYAVVTADSLKNAQNAIVMHKFDAVFLDMNLPDGNGLDWLHPLREFQPYLAIIVITGIGDIPTAVEAMRLGADHFLTKPLNTDTLLLFLARCLEVERLRRCEIISRRLLTDKLIYIGESPLMQKAWQLAKKCSETDTTVLLLGETGTGKGVFARWIHDSGARRDEPFVELNCSSLRGDLLASELFGHRKGAFTSAIEDREGLVETANGGTLFLDEIGDMDLAVQAQLLKVIEEKVFRRIGDNKQRLSEFRLICATNKDLSREAAAKRFRSDLYFRICVFPLVIPSLRQCLDDIPGMINHLLSVLHQPEASLTPAAMSLLQGYSWPGNIRELCNVLERACLLARNDLLDVDNFPGLLNKDEVSHSVDQSKVGWDLKSQEALHIRRALEHFNNDVTQTARALGISRATFYRKLKYNPDTPSI